MMGLRVVYPKKIIKKKKKKKKEKRKKSKTKILTNILYTNCRIFLETCFY